jgi:hypothetical protein
MENFHRSFLSKAKGVREIAFRKIAPLRAKFWWPRASARGFNVV